MKKSAISKITTVLAVMVSFGYQIHAQQYTATTAVTGDLQLSFTDMGGQGYGNNVGPVARDVFFNFPSLTENINFNAAAGTVDQSGSLTLDSAISSAVFNKTENINGQSVSGVLTINQAFANGGNVLMFDTGAQSIAPITPGSQTYILNHGFSAITSIPINATYSLLTGGKLYTGSFSYNLNAYPGLQLFSTFTTAGGLLVAGGFGSGNGSGFVGNENLTVNADNGFSISVASGETDTIDQGIINASTNLVTFSPGTTVITPGTPLTLDFTAPDHFSTLSLFSIGLLGIASFRRNFVPRLK